MVKAYAFKTLSLNEIELNWIYTSKYRNFVRTNQFEKLQAESSIQEKERINEINIVMGTSSENDVKWRYSAIFAVERQMLTSKDVIRLDASDMTFFDEFRWSRWKLTIFDEFWRFSTILKIFKIFKKFLDDFRQKSTIFDI